MPYKTLNSVTLASGASMAANIITPLIGLSNCIGYCVQADYTGTPTGVLKLQATMNNTTWVDIPGSAVNLTGSAGTQMWNTDGVYYESLRLVYVSTSGTGSLTAVISIKG